VGCPDAEYIVLDSMVYCTGCGAVRTLAVPAVELLDVLTSFHVVQCLAVAEAAQVL
jgi:hypothetical protein